MKTWSWLKMMLLAVAACTFALLCPHTARAQGGPSAGDTELARRYAPVLYFHPAELFRPQPVDVLVDTARLRQHRPNWPDINVLSRASVSRLLDYRTDSYFLDAWYGDDGSSEYKNYTAHRAYYRAALSPDAGGPPVVSYAHVVRDEEPPYVTIQYWLFYYYNDWFNKHEGDWEMVQVTLDAAGDPQWVVLSQHHGGTRRPWLATQIEEGTHPAVYVALGSHANYFWGDETYPNGTTIGNTRLEIMDRTGAADRVIPDVRLVPDWEDVQADPAAHSGLEWLLYGGRWGENASHGDFSGPLGPAHKGEQWEQPYTWGMDQPLDADTWYAHRLRVEVTGQAAEHARVSLRTADGGALPSAETVGSVALLHTDPPPGATIVADIASAPGFRYDLTITWPDAGAAQVTRYRFDDIPQPASGRASLELQTDDPGSLVIQGASTDVRPAASERAPATWDAADPVWFVGFLPASDIIKGVILSLLASMLPTLLWVQALYWADRYEKEPTRLLATAFFWGAAPALLVATVVRVFFRLPVDMLGPAAIEAVRAGLVAPLIEEALKAAVVIFVALRYRHEFDNVLDGIIYGAMVGFGFTMMANTLSYLGAFLLRGFAGLSNAVFVEGVLYGLNHASYSAIFGAGLGYARLARRRWQRWSVPLAAFGLAVTIHAAHNLAMRSTVGLNPLTILMTWGGVLVVILVMGWSLRRQRLCLESELVGEIPDEIYRTLTTRGGQFRAQWRVLWQDGLRGWQRVRHRHQQCAELAFKKMQQRTRPDELGLREEVERLRKEVAARIIGR